MTGDEIRLMHEHARLQMENVLLKAVVIVGVTVGIGVGIGVNFLGMHYNTCECK